MIYPFTIGRLSCAVISDGQMTPPWEPPLAAFFTPAAGVPERELHAALAAEGRHKGKAQPLNGIWLLPEMPLIGAPIAPGGAH